MTAIARENRANPSEAEKRLWRVISGKRLEGWKFTRQKPLGQFIADFYCAELMLVIEIDGDSHADREDYDCLRSDVLKSRFGITCIRYTNAQILENIDGVTEDLSKRIEGLKTKTPSVPLIRGRKRQSAT